MKNQKNVTKIVLNPDLDEENLKNIMHCCEELRDRTLSSPDLTFLDNPISSSVDYEKILKNINLLFVIRQECELSIEDFLSVKLFITIALMNCSNKHTKLSSILIYNTGNIRINSLISLLTEPDRLERTLNNDFEAMLFMGEVSLLFRIVS